MKTTEIPIDSPCHEDWDAMNGGRKRRHCGQCDKDVFHLSKMTSADARDLLNRRDDICVRYEHDTLGNILFRDDSFGGRLALQWEGVRKMLAVAALIAPGLGLLGCEGLVMGEPAGDRFPRVFEEEPVTVTIIQEDAPETPVVLEPKEPAAVEPLLRMGRRVMMGKRAPVEAPKSEIMGLL